MQLMEGCREQLETWNLKGRGHGTHCYDKDEDISVEGLIAGRLSDDNQPSFKKMVGSASMELLVILNFKIFRFYQLVFSMMIF